jgi:transposase
MATYQGTLPKARATGRPRCDEREAINGILYVLWTDYRWEDLPHDIGVKGYDSEPLRQALRRRRIIPIVPYRKNHVTVPRGRPPKDRVQGRYTRQRWKVERSFARANRFRRLDRLLEHGQKTYRAFVRAFFVKYYLSSFTNSSSLG